MMFVIIGYCYWSCRRRPCPCAVICLCAVKGRTAAAAVRGKGRGTRRPVHQVAATHLVQQLLAA